MVTTTTTERRKPILDSDIEDGIHYPSSDGKPMSDNAFQARAMHYIASALEEWFKDRKDVYVATDMLLYYRRGDPSGVVGPDHFVIIGVDSKHLRMSWRVWNENGLLPSLILEIGSPTTHARDAGYKRDLYARLGVGEYWRFDSIGNQFFPVLIGERLVDGEYHPIDVHTDASGILRGYSPVLGLDLCVRADGQLRLYDPLKREWRRSLSEEANARREEAEARRVAEVARREEAEARRVAEVARRQEAEARRVAEVARIEEADARRVAEVARERAEAEVRRLRELLAQANSDE